MVLGAWIGWVLGRVMPFAREHSGLLRRCAAGETTLREMQRSKLPASRVVLGRNRGAAMIQAWSELAQVRELLDLSAYGKSIDARARELLTLAERRVAVLKAIEDERRTREGSLRTLAAAEALAERLDAVFADAKAPKLALEVDEIGQRLDATTTLSDVIKTRGEAQIKRAERFDKRLIGSLQGRIEAATLAVRSLMPTEGVQANAESLEQLDRATHVLDLLLDIANGPLEVAKNRREILRALWQGRKEGATWWEFWREATGPRPNHDRETAASECPVERLEELAAEQDWLTFRSRLLKRKRKVEYRTAIALQLEPLSMLKGDRLEELIDQIDRSPCWIRWKVKRCHLRIARFAVGRVVGREETGGGVLPWYFKHPGHYCITAELLYDPSGPRHEKVSLGVLDVRVQESAETRPAQRAQRLSLAATAFIAAFPLATGFVHAMGPTFGSFADYIQIFTLAVTGMGGGGVLARQGLKTD
jgi:hypothetical protein